MYWNDDRPVKRAKNRRFVWLLILLFVVLVWVIVIAVLVSLWH